MERLASQAEGEVPAPEPASAGVEGAAATQMAPVVVLKETLIPESAGAGGEGTAAAGTEQMAPGNVVPVVELPPSEEYGDSEEIDPCDTPAYR